MKWANLGHLHRSALPINEPRNRYAIQVVSKIIDHMRRRKDRQVPNTPKPPKKKKPKKAKKRDRDDDDDDDDKKPASRIGEYNSVVVIYEAEVNRLCRLYGVQHTDSVGKRRLDVFWNIMKMFNSQDEEYNGILAEILVIYAQIRITCGRAYKLDEFQAAVRAVQLYFKETATDNVTIGTGTWTFPIVHLLNGHLIQRNMVPITFNPHGDKDITLKGERESHDELLWIDGTQVRRERRKIVIEQYARLLREYGYQPLPLPPDEGPPADDSDEEDVPVGEPRPFRMEDED